MSQLQTAFDTFQHSPHFWDWITLACLATSVLGFLIFLVWLLGLPGRIAVSRNHPDAEAVYTMGWVGFLAIVPWIQALIWAIKETDVVDIRRFPPEEQEVLDIQAKKYLSERTKKPKAKPGDAGQGTSEEQD